MFSVLLFFHSAIRWFVLGSLLFSIYTAYRGFTQKRSFTPSANSLRHWTATIAHIQLLLGMTLYIQSPTVIFRMSGTTNKLLNEQDFFRYVHIALMIIAIVLITIGSAKAKRQQDDQAKYRTMLRWFGVALLVIFIAIPWPFSPLAGRPLFRSF
jgi:cytochrome b561